MSIKKRSPNKFLWISFFVFVTFAWIFIIFFLFSIPDFLRVDYTEFELAPDRYPQYCDVDENCTAFNARCRSCGCDIVAVNNGYDGFLGTTLCNQTYIDVDCDVECDLSSKIVGCVDGECKILR
jgi:hypothetical protein